MDVKQRREALKMSRKSLSEATGLSAAQIYRVEQGRGSDEEIAVIDKAFTSVEKKTKPAPKKAVAAQRRQRTATVAETTGTEPVITQRGGYVPRAALLAALTRVVQGVLQARDATNVTTVREILTKTLEDVNETVKLQDDELGVDSSPTE